MDGFYHKVGKRWKSFRCGGQLLGTPGGVIGLAIIVAVIVGCGLRNPVEERGAGNYTIEDTTNGTSPDSAETSAGIISPNDPAEISVTAEEIYSEYKVEKNSEAGKKYFNKTIAVKGRFNDIDVSKKDPSGGYRATLQAGGFLNWVICSVDENERKEFEALRTDELITIKGLGDRYWIGGPRLKHCVLATDDRE